jgi:hypothetical protein
MKTSVNRQRPFLVSALFVSVLFASALLASVALAPGAIAQSQGDSAYCAVDGPESVLRCIAQAYAARDIDAFQRLLANDFVYASGDESNSWGADVELKVHRQMFAAPEIRTLTLTIADGYRVTPGDEPQTWVIGGVAATFVMDATRNGEPIRYDMTSTQGFRVRCMLEPLTHYVIYRWWEEAK